MVATNGYACHSKSVSQIIHINSVHYIILPDVVQKEKKSTLHTVVMGVKFSYEDQTHFLNQPVNMLISAAKLYILTWGSVEIDSL